jgi:hypothetical protein
MPDALVAGIFPLARRLQVSDALRLTHKVNSWGLHSVAVPSPSSDCENPQSITEELFSPRLLSAVSASQWLGTQMGVLLRSLESQQCAW